MGVGFCRLCKSEEEISTEVDSQLLPKEEDASSQPEHKSVDPNDGLVHNMSDIMNFENFLLTEFSFVDYLNKNFSKSSKRILVIGMGGGCDIFTAYSIYLRLSKLFGQEKEILYANTKSASFLKTDLKDHEKIIQGLYKLPKGLMVLEKGCDESCYGTSKLSQSVPRHPNGSPYLLVLPTESKDPTIATQENQDAMKKVFRNLKADVIIGIDTGGDCITGGMDWEGSAELGRDVQMQSAIVNSGIPHLILAFGPGCDGESSVKTMNESVTKLQKQGSFLGAFRLKDFLLEVRPWTENLSPMRTPNICYSAIMGQTPLENGSQEVDEVEYLKLVRHCSTRWIPRHWLSHGLAFNFSSSKANGAASVDIGKSA